jgi:hypothetical protein
MEGKVKTNRTVNFDRIVKAPPAEVYRLWTTEADQKLTELAENFVNPAAEEGKKKKKRLPSPAESSRSVPL